MEEPRRLYMLFHTGNRNLLLLYTTVEEPRSVISHLMKARSAILRKLLSSAVITLSFCVEQCHRIPWRRCYERSCPTDIRVL